MRWIKRELPQQFYEFVDSGYGKYTATALCRAGIESIEAAKEKIEDAIDHYELHILGRDDSSDVVLGADIQMDITWKNELENYMANQNGFAWIGKLFSPDKYDKTLGISYNEAALLEQMRAFVCMQEDKQVKPENAYVAYEDGAFVVKEEVLGTAIDKSKLQRSLRDCLPLS